MQKAYKILIAEDDAFSRRLIETIINSLGHRCISVKNGQEAIDKLMRENFDIILLDLEMPKKDGLETVTAIRNEFFDEKSNIPVIALTGHKIEDQGKTLKAAGFSDYLLKDELSDQLEEILKKHLGNRNNTTDEIQHASDNKLYDLSYFIKVSNNDPAFIKEMVIFFVTDTPNTIQEIKKLYQQSNWPALKQIVHKFSPHLSYLEMHSSVKLADYIENFTLELKNLSEIPELIRKIEENCIIVIESLKKDFNI